MNGVDVSLDYTAAAEYVQLLNAAYAQLHAVDPNVTVLGGALAGTDATYLNWMLAEGAQFDGLSVHPYTRNYDNPNGAGGPPYLPARPGDDPTAFAEGVGLASDLNERWSFEYGLNALNDILEANGRGNVDLWITEFNTAINDFNGDPIVVPDQATQAEYLYEALQIVEGMDFIHAITVFQLYDAGDGDFGLLNPDGTWRPSGGVLSGHIAEFGDGSNGSNNTFYGTLDDDVIYGSDGDDILLGDLGNDILVASNGNDILLGGEGIDQVDYYGSAGNSSNFTFIQNEDGSMTAISAITGEDTLWDVEGIWFDQEALFYFMDDLTYTTYGTAGDDVINGTARNDLIIADAGVDIINASAGDDTIIGQNVATGSNEYNQVDYLGAGSNSSNFIFNDNGDGSVTVTSTNFGTDTLWGIGGVWFEEENQWYAIDSLFGGSAAQPATTNTIYGTEGDDVLFGTNANDLIIGDDGVDIFHGSFGDDVYVGRDVSNSIEEYNQIDFLGANSFSSNFNFSDNGDGSITVVSAEFGQDQLWGIDGAWFEAENQWYAIDSLFG